MLPGLQMAAFLLCLHRVKREGVSSLVFLIRKGILVDQSPIYTLPLPHGSSRVVLCDIKPCQGYDWLEEFLADQSKLMHLALHCPGKVYIERPGALVQGTVASPWLT